jgi:hypothetical protein
MGEEMMNRLQSARSRLLEPEAGGFLPAGVEHAINSGA